MIESFRCPLPGCAHSHGNTNTHSFATQSTLLRHLNHNDHQHTFHLADQTICTSANIYSCCHTTCPTAPTRFFRSLDELSHHNTTHHPPPHAMSNLQPIPTTQTDISTAHFFANASDGSRNLWHHGIPFILSNTTHHPPDFRSTWRRHLKKRNKANFLRLQAHTIFAISDAYAYSLDSTPFWWLLLHLDMLVLAPSTATQRSNNSIHHTISDRINAIFSGDIEYCYNMAMSCTRHSQNSTPTSTSHNQTAQRAADSDQFRTAVARSTPSSSVASINNSNINIVRHLYTQPVPPHHYPPKPPASQPYSLPGDICTTILHASRNKGAGVNADSIDIFIDLVQANIASVPTHLNFIFNQIYQNNLPPPITHYFTDVYLFCLHKDPLDKSKLRPLGIPTAIRRLIASHVAHTFREKFARHMLPYNYAVGTPNGTNLIINSMQLQVEKYITLPQSLGNTPSRATVFFDLTNQFNSVSREAFFDVIAGSFPEILPLTSLFYNDAGTVHHKWADGSWRTLLMEEGVSQGCPLSPIFASLVVARLLQPLDDLLKSRASARLLAGNVGDDDNGGITHLLGYVDDVSACVPLEDLHFLCNNFASIGAPLGCFVNPMKTRILTSTSGHSPLPALRLTNPHLATSISSTIAQYSTKPNPNDILGPALPVELTTGFRLLGSPIGSAAFAQDYFDAQLTTIQDSIALMSTALTDPHTKLRLFSQCLIQKIPHLLGCDVLYHYDTDNPPPSWTDWNGPLTSATNHIIAKFISDLVGVTILPHHALLICQLNLNAGGLGIIDPRSRAIPDFMLTFTTSTRHATTGIHLNRHLRNVHLHHTISALYSIDTNPHSLILQRYQHILPNIAAIACPPTIPRTDLSQYFLTTLSPHSARSRLKLHNTATVHAELYNHVFANDPEHFHLLPSILSPATSYPLIAMSRSPLKNRLTPLSFLLCIRRKLRLPIYPHNTPCTCGHQTHDIFGDHAFHCDKGSKKRAHNVIATEFALALSPALTQAGYLYPNTPLGIESQFHLRSDPTARPFDIFFSPDPTSSHVCPFTTIGADINITGPASPPKTIITEDILKTITANADNNLQRHERSKLGRAHKPATPSSPFIHGDSVIGEIYHKNMVLIPFTVDPHGRFGPMLQAFLTSTNHSPHKPWCTSPHNSKRHRPYANLMYSRASTSPCPLGILTSADRNWKASASPSRRTFFGNSYTAPTPSIHTLQLLGLGISKAFSSLLCSATRTFRLPPTAPTFDLYSFLTLEDTYPVRT